MSLQEALRTVGLGLDVGKVARVELTIDQAGIHVMTTSAYGVRSYAWEEIKTQSRAQQEHRRAQPRAAPWMDPAALTRWSVLLRVVGQLLDAQGVSNCVIDATVASPDAPESCRVQVTAEGRAVLDGEAVRLQLLRLRTRHVEARTQAPAAPAARPWWAFWRRD
ncbi:MAG TPA: hypothetical protein VFE37_27995 [Chloroflexota bacterium]|nr:hypothetical protein [Chloroflexota bacterium]